MTLNTGRTNWCNWKLSKIRFTSDFRIFWRIKEEKGCKIKRFAKVNVSSDQKLYVCNKLHQILKVHLH